MGNETVGEKNWLVYESMPFNKIQDTFKSGETKYIEIAEIVVGNWMKYALKVRCQRYSYYIYKLLHSIPVNTSRKDENFNFLVVIA